MGLLGWTLKGPFHRLPSSHREVAVLLPLSWRLIAGWSMGYPVIWKEKEPDKNSRNSPPTSSQLCGLGQMLFLSLEFSCLLHETKQLGQLSVLILLRNEKIEIYLFLGWKYSNNRGNHLHSLGALLVRSQWDQRQAFSVAPIRENKKLRLWSINI